MNKSSYLMFDYADFSDIKFLTSTYTKIETMTVWDLKEYVQLLFVECRT